MVVTVNMKLLASTCSQAKPDPKTLAAASLNLHRQTGWCLRCSSAAQQMLNECAGTASCQAGCAGQQQLRDNCSSLTYFSGCNCSLHRLCKKSDQLPRHAAPPGRILSGHSTGGHNLLPKCCQDSGVQFTGLLLVHEMLVAAKVFSDGVLKLWSGTLVEAGGLTGLGRHHLQRCMLSSGLVCLCEPASMKLTELEPL